MLETTPRRSAATAKCGVCRKNPATEDGKLCAWCAKALARRFSEGTTMTKKTAAAAKKNNEPKPETVTVEGRPRRVHRVAAPEAPPPEPAVERTVELDDTEAVPESVEQPAAAVAAAAEPEATAAVDDKHQTRTNATLVLRHAVKKLAMYDYSTWGVEGVSGALAVLKNALAKMEALRKRGGGGKAKVAPGAIVRIREKRRPHFEGVLAASDFEGIKVIAANGRKLRAELVSGERVMLDAKDVEVAS